MDVPNIPLRIIGHRAKVLQLYKRALRNLDTLFLLHRDKKARVRYEATLLRKRFEENRNCPEDMAKDLLIAGQNELKRNLPPAQLEFANSYGGLCFQRESIAPDFVLDNWHPLEKAQYPEYFARREQRKKEFNDMWNKKYSSNTQFGATKTPTKPPPGTPPMPKCK